MEKSKRVAIYSRVSTHDQNPESQLLDLRQYCEARGWQSQEFCDKGISGAKGEDKRPSLKALMDAVRKRKFDVVLVWRFDRFARSLPHLVNSLEELKSLNVDFVSYQESIDTSTAQGRLVFGVMASLAEFERSLIRDRVMAGLNRARSQGKRLGRPKTLIDPKRLLALKAKGFGVRAIAKELGISKDTVCNLLRCPNNPPSFSAV
ncbi:MAG: recombinase family protein [Elusimicrobiota bacterium]